jgi:hypothetical protein
MTPATRANQDKLDACIDQRREELIKLRDRAPLALLCGTGAAARAPKLGGKRESALQFPQPLLVRELKILPEQCAIHMLAVGGCHGIVEIQVHIPKLQRLGFWSKPSAPLP